MTKSFFAITLCVALIFSAIISKNNPFNRSGTSIEYRDTKNELMLIASFPKEKSGIVQDFLKRSLQLSELSGFDRLRVRTYLSEYGPNFNITTRLGYIKVSMPKRVNPIDNRDKMVELGEGLKRLLL